MMKNPIFSDLVEINPRVALKKGREYPFVKMVDIDTTKRYVCSKEYRVFKNGGSKFQTGDTLFARITPCLENGKIAQFQNVKGIVAFGSTEFFVFRPRMGVSDPGYIYYLAKSDLIRKPAEKSMTGTSGRQRAVMTSITNIEIPAPPLPIQRKIAAILSAYDNLIENNLRRIKILENMAQLLYKEWFVKFRFPGHEQVRFVDSPLGMIPEGWEVVTLENVAEVSWGDTSTTKKSYVEEGYIAFSAAGPDGRMAHYDFDREGIVLSAIGANCGKTWFTKGKWSCIKNTIRFWTRDPRISTEYLYFATLGDSFWPKRGSAQPFISQGDAKKTLIIIPKNMYAKQFKQVIEPIFNYTRCLEEKNSILRKTRDLLLPKLISGELDVSNLDITLPEELSA